MGSLPNPSIHNWATVHVGGATNDPVVLHLTENNLITNGSFEEALSGWSNESGTAPSRVNAGSGAARGNYVMNLKASSVTHKAIAYTGAKALLTGFVKFISTDANGSFDIDLYVTASDSYVASPASKFVSLTINSEDAYVDATEYYLPFYLLLDTTAGSYVHINFGCDSGVEVYIDDLRLNLVNSIVELSEPHKLSVRYERIVDADVELWDKTQKTYLRGWRPIFTIGYDFIEAAGLVKNIKLSEGSYIYFIPNSDNLLGAYVRYKSDFNAPPFMGRFLGHSNDLELPSVYLFKNKPREYGETYFTVNNG